VGLRRQALATDPLDVVLLVDAVVVLHLLRQQLVTIVTQQFYGFLNLFLKCQSKNHKFRRKT
jgi:hypothetical protein